MKSIIFFTLLFFIVGCQNASLKKKLDTMLASEVIFPTMSIYPDSVAQESLLDSKTKLVVWYDSTGCSSCDMKKLWEWDEILTYSTGLGNNFNVVFVFTPSENDLTIIGSTIRYSALNYPVFLDNAGRFSRLNRQIPTDRRFHTFLLNKDNQVVLVGNPLGNEKLWELYKEQIRNLINDKE